MHFHCQCSCFRTTAILQGAGDGLLQCINGAKHRPGNGALFGIARPANFDQFWRIDTDLGRVVITHSTYVEGLIPWLKSLSREAAIQTITPAVISKVKGRCQTLQLRVSVPIRGGFKMVARKGSSAQEVFVVTELERGALQNVVDRHRP